MCTSLIKNGSKIIVGWNLDLLDMPYRINTDSALAAIEVFDQKEGWMPLFGANARGDFVAMPTCWPYDAKSDPAEECMDVIHLDIDLLLSKRTFSETKELVQHTHICSIPGVTFQAQLSDRRGNVLQIIPGQGWIYLEKPKFSVMTNFSPFKGNREQHPYMGLDRYRTAERLLQTSSDSFDVSECFSVLKAVSQTVCPTVVSMVFDVSENTVYWCENRNFDHISRKKFSD